jgi:PAS domain S-box-containing protein
MNKNITESAELSGPPERTDCEPHLIRSKAASILADLPDIIMELDTGNVCTWANKAGLEFFGDDVVGSTVSRFFEGEQDTSKDVQFCSNVGNSAIKMETWQRRKDNEIRLLAWSCRAHRDEIGEVTGACATARDITEQTRIDEQILMHNKMIENTIESLLHPFYVLDVNTYRILMANKATAIYGNITEDSTCYALTHNRETPCSGSEHVCPLKEVQRTKRPVTLEHLHYDREGNPMYIEVHGYPVMDSKGEVVQMIEYEFDITERKNAEKELLRGNERMKNDLEAAAEIQKSLLPPDYAEIKGVSFASAFRPCDELGGDIFNAFQLDGRHLGLYILDVSGHGVSAALLSVTLSRILSPQPDQSSLLRQQIGSSAEYHLVQPAEVANKLNRQFPMKPDKLQYFTLVYGILDLETHDFRYVVAGHPRPIHISRNSGAICIDDGGIPIGALRDSRYVECSINLKPGDRLFLYSDGIMETTSPDDVEFGQGRLIETLDSSHDIPLRKSISSLLEDVDAWRGGGRLTDDVSILGVEIMERPANRYSD